MHSRKYYKTSFIISFSSSSLACNSVGSELAISPTRNDRLPAARGNCAAEGRSLERKDVRTEDYV